MPFGELLCECVEFLLFKLERVAVSCIADNCWRHNNFADSIGVIVSAANQAFPHTQQRRQSRLKVVHPCCYCPSSLAGSAA